MPKIKVYAKTEIALHARMAHPIDGVMRASGSYWEDDTFTYRRLRDGDITTDEAEAWHPEKGAKAAAVNPGEAAKAQAELLDKQAAAHPVGISKPPKT